MNEQSFEIAVGDRVHWLNKHMVGTIVGPSPEGPWDWEIKFDHGGTVLAYTYELVAP